MNPGDSTRGDEGFLLDLLNSTPILAGSRQDLLDTQARSRRWLRERGGTGSAAERDAVRTARDVLQQVVRGEAAPTALAPLLEDVRSVPMIGEDGVTWTTEVSPARRLALQAVLTWDTLRRTNPGRLRPCANPDCALFLIDHSRPNSARWCSMAVCGNRMKARRHYAKRN